MKHILTIAFAALILLSFAACNQKKNVKEFYIVSKGDSTDFSNKYAIKDTSLQPPPPPPGFSSSRVKGVEYFYNTVIIFDSTDLVYLYQTDFTENKNSLIKVPRGCIVDESEDYYKFIKHPPFIGLRPENILKFDSKNFLDFIKANNDIFQLDTTRRCNRILMIASNKDTIENPAFYDLMKLTKQDRKTLDKVFPIIRMTTEEENKVIYCKRRNVKYDPANVKWSTNFLNGKYYPLSSEYDSIVKYVIPNIFTARKLFRMDTLKVKSRK